MATRDIIVIGASAGGVQALSTLVSDLSADLPAAVFIVLHIPSDSPSLLPDILSREARLPVAHARNGEQIVKGKIYVAPPNQHLLVEDAYVKLLPGPKENLHRPSIDVLFRSAARWGGPRVIGVVLTGARVLSGTNKHNSAGTRTGSNGGRFRTTPEPYHHGHAGRSTRTGTRGNHCARRHRTSAA